MCLLETVIHTDSREITKLYWKSGQLHFVYQGIFASCHRPLVRLWLCCISFSCVIFVAVGGSVLHPGQMCCSAAAVCVAVLVISEEISGRVGWMVSSAALKPAEGLSEVWALAKGQEAVISAGHNHIHRLDRAVKKLLKQPLLLPPSGVFFLLLFSHRPSKRVHGHQYV